MATPRDTMFDLDATKFLGTFELPKMDVDVMVEGQRKNMDALSAAQKSCVEGAQKLFKYQVDTIQKITDEFNASFKEITSAKTPQESVVKQTELMQKAFEQALGRTREMTELVVKSNTDARAPLNKRFTEGLDEFGQMFKKAAPPTA